MTPSQPSGDEAAVRAVEAAYDAAWRAGDVEGLLACLSADAVLVNPMGEPARGHAAIRRELEAVLTGPARGTTHTSAIVRVDFVATDVAIVDGVATVEGAARGQPAFTLTHRFTDVLVRRDAHWVIAHIRACPGSPSTAA